MPGSWRRCATAKARTLYDPMAVSTISLPRSTRLGWQATLVRQRVSQYIVAMDPVHFLSAESLKAVSHPLRQRILALLVRRGELSGREIRDTVPGASKNPYYHLGVLRRAGLIRLARTEKRRGSSEKYYAAVARTFSMDPGELVAGSTGAAATRSGILSVARTGAEEALDALARSLEQKTIDTEDEIPFVNLCTLRLRPHRAEDLRARMKSWLEDAAEAVREGGGSDGADDRVEYVFYQLLFPRAET